MKKISKVTINSHLKNQGELLYRLVLLMNRMTRVCDRYMTNDNSPIHATDLTIQLLWFVFFSILAENNKSIANNENTKDEGLIP